VQIREMGEKQQGPTNLLGGEGIYKDLRQLARENGGSTKGKRSGESGKGGGNAKKGCTKVIGLTLSSIQRGLK